MPLKDVIKKSLGLLLILTLPVLACAPFFPEAHFGYLAEEVALIIWDAEAEQQHFIRRAGFWTEAKKVGFLVPTPTQPEFGEMDAEVFDALDQITQPKVVYKDRRSWKVTSLFAHGCSMGDAAPSTASPRGVEVLDQLSVAGQEVAVLRATEVEALEKWLTDNDFPFDPASRDWLAPYVADGYIISAFRYLAPEEGKSLSSQSIRMTFATDKPYFPYREPERIQDKTANPTKPSRSLRIYLLSSERLKPLLGEARWTAAEKFSAPVESLPPELKELTTGQWLSVLDDTSLTRPSEHDLFFEPSEDQSQVKPPQRVVYRDREIPIFIELVLAIGVGFFFLLRRRRRS